MRTRPPTLAKNLRPLADEKNMNVEQLQEYENRGYALTSAWLQLGLSPSQIRAAVHRAYDGHGCVGPMTPDNWRWGAHNQIPTTANRWAAMAGCELAIEEHEAANVDT